MLTSLPLLLTAAMASEPSPRLTLPFDSQVAFDMGGEGLVASLNYENMALVSGARHRLLLRAGIGYLPLYVDGHATAGNLILPLGLRYLLGHRAHHLEVGASAPLRWSLAGNRDPASRSLSLSWMPSVGYRYQDFEGGRWFVGVAYSPRMTHSVLGLGMRHWARLSVGMRL